MRQDSSKVCSTDCADRMRPRMSTARLKTRPNPGATTPRGRPPRYRRIATGALIAVLLIVRGASAEPVSFRNDVMAVLSKAGCNQGVCHGNLNGKNGFKLSLRGEDPAFDWAALTRDTLGRRIDRI